MNPRSRATYGLPGSRDLGLTQPGSRGLRFAAGFDFFWVFSSSSSFFLFFFLLVLISFLLVFAGAVVLLYIGL